jgi:acyl-[acyl-carrier-protein] desaturase
MPQVTPLLKPVEKCWQPADLLPESSDPDFLDKVRADQWEGCWHA